MSKPSSYSSPRNCPYATIEGLGPDFEVRHCDGANRDELLPAIADVGRDPDPIGDEGRRRGPRGRQQPQRWWPGAESGWTTSTFPPPPSGG